MVADGGDLQAGGAERFDGRLVMEHPRQQWRGADVVAGGHDDRVRVLGLEPRDMRREIFHPAGRDRADAPVRSRRRLERAVEVVEPEDLNVRDRTPSRGRRWRARRAARCQQH